MECAVREPMDTTAGVLHLFCFCDGWPSHLLDSPCQPLHLLQLSLILLLSLKTTLLYNLKQQHHHYLDQQEQHSSHDYYY